MFDLKRFFVSIRPTFALDGVERSLPSVTPGACKKAMRFGKYYPVCMAKNRDSRLWAWKRTRRPKKTAKKSPYSSCLGPCVLDDGADVPVNLLEKCVNRDGVFLPPKEKKKVPLKSNTSGHISPVPKKVSRAHVRGQQQSAAEKL